MTDRVVAFVDVNPVRTAEKHRIMVNQLGPLIIGNMLVRPSPNGGRVLRFKSVEGCPVSSALAFEGTMLGVRETAGTVRPA